MKKKNNDRTKRSTLFLLIGLAIALSLTLSAFEYKDHYDTPEIFVCELPIPPDIPLLPFPKPKEPVMPKTSRDKSNLNRIIDSLIIVNKATDDTSSITTPNKGDTCTTCKENKFKGEVKGGGPDTTDQKEYTWVSFMPSFKECSGLKSADDRKSCFDEKLFDHLKTHLKTPGWFDPLIHKGRVIVEFVVEKDGTIGNYKVVSDIGGGAAESVIDALKLLPVLEPGKNNGRPVRVKYSLPVYFK